MDYPPLPFRTTAHFVISSKVQSAKQLCQQVCVCALQDNLCGGLRLEQKLCLKKNKLKTLLKVNHKNFEIIT